MAERVQQLLEIGFKYLGHIKYFQFHFPGTTRRYKIVKKRIFFLSCDIWHEHHIGSNSRDSVSGFSEKYKSVSFGAMGGGGMCTVILIRVCRHKVSVFWIRLRVHVDSFGSGFHSAGPCGAGSETLETEPKKGYCSSIVHLHLILIKHVYEKFNKSLSTWIFLFVIWNVYFPSTKLLSLLTLYIYS